MLSFIVYIKTDEIYKDIAKDAEKKILTIQTMNKTDLMEKNKKVIGSMKDELGEKIIKRIVGLKNNI